MSLQNVRVGDLAEQVRGVSYGKEDASTTPLPGYLPVLRAGNITDDGLVFSDLVFVPAERVSDRQKVRRHDVVVAASSGSLDVVGKAAPVLSDFDGGFGAFCKVLRPNSKVHPAYFAQFFKTQEYRRRVSALAEGANINNLRNEHLDEMLIPLPSIAEQRRIAAILDKADMLRAQRRAALAQLDTLTRSIFLDMFGDPRENQKRWSKVSMEYLISDLRGGAALEPDDFVESGFPILHKGAIKPNGEIGLDAKKKTFATADYATANQRCMVNRNFLAVTLRDLVPSGPSIGLVADLRNGPFDEYLLAQGAYAFQIDLERVVPEYLVCLSNMPNFRNILRQNAVGSTQIHIRTPIYLAISVPLPTIELQRKFARRISTLEKLKASYRASLVDMNAFFASLQHRAFRSEL